MTYERVKEGAGAMAEDKICPKCGMQLVGNSNYCMGCGINVSYGVDDGSLGKDGATSGRFVEASNKKEYLERVKVAQIRRAKKKKKNILEEGGIVSMLLVMIGLIAGVVLGIFVLKWYFAPKDEVLVYYKDMKVTEIAGVEHIDPPKEQEFDQVVGAGQTIDMRGEPNKKEPPEVVMKAEPKKEADPAKQKFKGKRTIRAKGDRVTEWEEELTWDVKDLDPNSVTYVVNHLTYRYDRFRDHVFIDFKLTQTREEVCIYLRFFNLELPENVTEMAKMGVISSEQTTTSGKERFLSLKKTQWLFEDENWKPEGEESKTVIIEVD